jgi:integrase
MDEGRVGRVPRSRLADRLQARRARTGAASVRSPTSFASLLLAEGRTVHYVAAQLGHSPALTLSTYGHLIAEYADAGPINVEQKIAEARADGQAATGEIRLEAVERAS